VTASLEHEQTIGHRIRAARELRGISLRRLAQSTGLSSGFLSQLENGRSNASVATLKKLAEALGATTAELIDGTSPEGRVLRKADRPAFHAGDGLVKYLLTRTPQRNLEVYTGEIEAGGGTGDELYVHGNAQEVLVCLSGRVEVRLAAESYVLDGGDSIEYLSSTPHGLRNVAGTGSEVMWILSPPTP
jgi:transcriptional regulator with XRE-family HTH domain